MVLWHYHTEKQVNKLEFMFGRIKIFNKSGYEIIRNYYKQDDVSKGGKV